MYLLPLFSHHQYGVEVNQLLRLKHSSLQDWSVVTLFILLKYKKNFISLLLVRSALLVKEGGEKKKKKRKKKKNKIMLAGN